MANKEIDDGDLCIDTTFNLSEFYVTQTTYKDILLENTCDGKEPVFIGPTLVHMTRSYGSYCHLACKIKEVEGAPILEFLLPMENQASPRH